jgi:hypothetical protein
MITMLMEMTAAEHRAQLRRVADRSRTAATAGTRHNQPSRIELREAAAEDRQVLVALAALDDAAPIGRPALIASADGRAIAAVELDSRRVVADPFVFSADAVSLLTQRAGQLHSATARRRLRFRIPRLRLA